MSSLPQPRDHLRRYVEVGHAVAAQYRDVEAAFISGSLVEGFGNDTSDLDVFVLTRSDPVGSSGAPHLSVEQDGVLIEVDVLGDIRTDTEVWTTARIQQVAAALAACDPWHLASVISLNAGHLDFAHRLRIGIGVLGDDVLDRLRSGFDWQHLALLLAQRRLGDYSEHCEDAVGAIRAKDPLTAVLNSRSALGAAVDALLALRGQTNGKAKWREHKLRAAGGEELMRRYLEAELDPSSDPGALLERSRGRLRLAGEWAAEVSATLMQRAPDGTSIADGTSAAADGTSAAAGTSGGQGGE